MNANTFHNLLAHIDDCFPRRNSKPLYARVRILENNRPPVSESLPFFLSGNVVNDTDLDKGWELRVFEVLTIAEQTEYLRSKINDMLEYPKAAYSNTVESSILDFWLGGMWAALDEISDKYDIRETMDKLYSPELLSVLNPYRTTRAIVATSEEKIRFVEEMLHLLPCFPFTFKDPLFAAEYTMQHGFLLSQKKPGGTVDISLTWVDFDRYIQEQKNWDHQSILGEKRANNGVFVESELPTRIFEICNHHTPMYRELSQQPVMK